MSEIFNSIKKCFVPPVSIHINGLVENGLLEYADVERLRKWLLVKKNQSSTFKCVCEEAFLDFNQVTQTLL